MIPTEVPVSEAKLRSPFARAAEAHAGDTSKKVPVRETFEGEREKQDKYANVPCTD